MSFTRRSGGRRAARATAWLVVASLAGTACAGSADPGSTPSAGTQTVATDAEPAISDSEVAAGVEGLRQAGISVIADETAPAVNPLSITADQATEMVITAELGMGLLGSDLDELAPLPPEAPPMSYLLAAWVSTDETPGARQAHAWMGDQEWRHAPDLVFPTAAVALFVSDFATAVEEADTGAVPPETSSATPSAEGFRAMSATASSTDACSIATAFLGNIIKRLFDALKIAPPSGGGIFGAIASFIVRVWNVAVDLVQGMISTVVSTITEPIYAILRTGAAALGAASIAVSYFQRQRLTVTVDPPMSIAHYRFSVGSEQEMTGQFVASAPKLTASWPPIVVKCAEAVGRPLPELVQAGDRATWTVMLGGELISLRSATSTVGADRMARVTFVTGHEDEETAKGEPITGVAYVRARIPRRELSSLVDLATSQLLGALDGILANMPVQARQAAQAAFHAVFDKTLDGVKRSTQAVGGIFTITGTGLVAVLFHKPPDTTETTVTTPVTVPFDPKDEFCRVLAEQTGDPNAGLVAIGQAGLAKMARLIPLAPPFLLDELAVANDTYTSAAAGDWNGVTSKAEAFAVAILTIFDYCGLTPPDQGGAP